MSYTGTMTFSRRLMLLAAGVLAAIAPSCRVPETRLTQTPAMATIYDPETADALAARFPQSPEQQALTKRYKTALANPISVVAWEQTYSQWQVFYATNRVPQPAAAGGVRFGQEYGQVVSVGTCRVTLPKRERGTATDPAKSSVKWASWLPGSKPSAELSSKQNVEAKAELTTPKGNDEFDALLRDAVARAPEHDVLVFVHGFNVGFDESLMRASQVALDMPFNGAVIAYDWPSQGGASLKAYQTDEQVAGASIEPFVHFLEGIDRALPPETKIHVLVHSMGNRVVLNGLGRLPERFRKPARFDNLVLAAPDLGVSEFAKLAPAVVASARRVTLYACDSDTALGTSKALHQEQRIGDADPPFVVRGVETIDASKIETSFLGHSYYGSNRSALSDLFSVVKEDRGAAQRPWLRMQTGATGNWWAIDRQPTEVRCVWHFEDKFGSNGTALR